MTQSSAIPYAVPDSGKTQSNGLRVQSVTKEFPTPAQPLVVLRGVSFTLNPGEGLAIVGPSGSGKSTLLNILGTLEQPSSGSLAIDDVDPFTLSSARLARFRSEKIGFVFQDHHLLPQCSALENVLVPKLAAGRVSGSDTQHAKELLRQVGLTDRASHLPAELSGGERQRVAVARAMINRPALLLADEPTGNLDQKNSASIGDLLRSAAAASGAMLVVVTHSAELAASFDRTLRMADGQLIESK